MDTSLMTNAFLMAIRLPVRGIVLGLVLSMIVLPLFTHAQTSAELEDQIKALLERINALQGDLGGPTTNTTTTGTAGTGTGSGTNPPGTGGVAPLSNLNPGNGSVLRGGLFLTRDIARGATGEDVARLQSFLSQDISIYPEGVVSGRYINLTEAAVKRFQVACGIVSSGTYAGTGYGRVGPRTRAALADGCPNATPAEVGAFIRVTPISGGAPLTVTVAATVNTSRSCERSTYLLDFGDGTAPFELTVPATRCVELSQSIAHTYATAGTYVVTLSIGEHQTTVNVQVTNGPSTGTTPPPTTVSTITRLVLSAHNYYQDCWVSYEGNVYDITRWLPVYPGGSSEIAGTCGSDTQFTNFFRSRHSGQTALLSQQGTFMGRLGTIATTPALLADSLSASPLNGNAPITVTFNARINGAASCAGGEYTLDFGDGEKAPLQFAVNACRAHEFNITHRYDTGGAKVAKLYKERAAQINNLTPPVSSVTLNVVGTAATFDPQLSITPSFEGLATKIQARFTLENACTGFTVEWGDGRPSATRAHTTVGCNSNRDTTTHVHTYPSITGSTNYTLRLSFGPPTTLVQRTASIVIVGTTTTTTNPPSRDGCDSGASNYFITGCAERANGDTGGGGN
ncbi:MAG: cytochrome b5 domain-containing protein [Patescibacteria group bacterium]